MQTPEATAPPSHGITATPIPEATATPSTMEIVLPQADTWQEAYAALLWIYKPLTAAFMHGIGNFIIYDIDKDGTPELIVLEFMTYYRSVSVYTFRNGEAVRLDFENPHDRLFGSFITAEGNHPWIIENHPVGSGGRYRRISIDGNRISAVYSVDAFLNEEGWDNLPYIHAAWPNFTQWHAITVNGEASDTAEFERIFGIRAEWTWLAPFTINEANITLHIIGMEIPQADTWQEAYEAIMQNYAALEADLFYLIHDIDMNGTPELIIVGYLSGGDSVDIVYTFKDGSAVRLENDRGIGVFLGARSGVVAAPNNEPGIVTYAIGSAAGTFGTNRYYQRFMLDGDKLIIDSHGRRCVDFTALNEMFTNHGRGDYDQNELAAAIEAHTHFYLNGIRTTEDELNRIFSGGEPLIATRFSTTM